MEPAPIAPDPAAPLGERAQAFARCAAREKAALLQAILPRLLAAAPELWALACQSRELDPGSAEAAQLWITGCVPLIACVRELGESLSAIAARGRPPLGAARRGKDGRVRLIVRPRHLAERLLEGRSRVELLFEEGVRPEELPLAQASFYRETEPQGGVASILGADLAGDGLLRALFALFVEGRVALVAPDAASAGMVPRLAELFAPLVERGWLAFAPAAEPVGASPPAIVPWMIVPYLYAADELSFQARSLASSLVLQRSFERDAVQVLVLDEEWEQRELFLSLVQKALTPLPAFSAFTTPSLDAARLDELASPGALAPATLPVVELQGGDPAHFLPAALAFASEQLGGGRGLTLTVHPSQEEDLRLGPLLDDTLRALRFGAIAINAPSTLIRLQPALPWGPHPTARSAEPGSGFANNAWMVGRVEKVLLRAPLVAFPKPAYFCDNRRAGEIGPRLARLAAAPSLGALASLLGTLRKR